MMQPELMRFIRFLIVGGGGVLVTLLVTHIGVVFFHLWYFFAFLIATLFSWTFVFAVNAWWTFPDSLQDNRGKRYLQFLAGYAGIFCINASLVYIGTSILGLHYLVSITVATACTAVLTFLFSKHVIYTSR